MVSPAFFNQSGFETRQVHKMLKISFALFLCFVASCTAAPLSSPRINPLLTPPVSAKALNGLIDYGKYISNLHSFYIEKYKNLLWICFLGVSELVDVRLTGCASAPCQLNAGGSYSLEIDFRPRKINY